MTSTVILSKDDDTENPPPGRPGWSIVADLTPRELLDARRLQKLKKLVGIGLVGVLLLCLGGFAAAFMKHRSDSDSLADEQRLAQKLTAQQSSFADVTNLQVHTARVNGDLQALMQHNVDTAALVKRLHAALPGTMALTGITVTISAAPAGSTTAASSTHAIIGTITLNGSAQKLMDSASYVSALSKIPGVIDIVPNHNQRNTTSTAWSVTAHITDALYVSASPAQPAGSSPTGGK